MYFFLQASRPKEETHRWLPLCELPPGRRLWSGLPEDAWSSECAGAWSLSAISPRQTSSSAGPALSSGTEIPAWVPLTPGENHWTKTQPRSQLEQKDMNQSSMLEDYVGRHKVETGPPVPSYKLGTHDPIGGAQAPMVLSSLGLLGLQWVKRMKPC